MKSDCCRLPECLKWLPFLVVLGCVPHAWANEPQKSLTFSHKFHLRDVGAECSSCHDGATTSEKLGDRIVPTMDTCGNCHDVAEESQCGMCHKDLENIESIASPKRDLVFSHAKHLGMKGVICGMCHKALDAVDLAGPDNLPTMAVCMNCHQETATSQDCRLCHTKVQSLRPRSHRADWTHEHNEHVRSGDSTCTVCHTQDFCQECHEGGRLTKARNATRDLYALSTPESGPQQTMTIKRVHDLNYRFTHAIDLKGKERQCRTCHDQAAFCDRCHDEQRAAGGGRPAWHGGRDWGAIAGGVGTGGGKHAELLKRDPERCAACHDVQGEDPVCLLCHTDRTPGLGNDPKTHKAGYMKNEAGPWMDDPNYTCFRCHVNTRQAGQGFCGYCHGDKD